MNDFIGKVRLVVKHEMARKVNLTNGIVKKPAQYLVNGKYKTVTYLHKW
jgi:hypothetical protein